MADESIQNDADTRLALGAAKYRTGVMPQDDPDVAFWWIHEKKIPEDLVLMAARLRFEPTNWVLRGGSAWELVDWREATASLSTRQIVFLASDLAESVLPIFEGQRPKDDRPRLAIAATRAWAKDPTEENRTAAATAATAAMSATNALLADATAAAAESSARIILVAAAGAALAASTAASIIRLTAETIRFSGDPTTELSGVAQSAVDAAARAVAAPYVDRDIRVAKDKAHVARENTKWSQRLRCAHYLLKFPGTPELA